MRTILLSLLLVISGASWAEDAVETGPVSEISTVEQAFVASISQYSKAQIIEQFGEPATMEDMKLASSGEIIASIWHYHFINTNPEGEYYETTELDFLGDKVVMVVFMNHNGEEKISIEPPAAPQNEEPQPDMML